MILFLLYYSKNSQIKAIFSAVTPEWRGADGRPIAFFRKKGLKC